MTAVPADQLQRARFIGELDRNFSVVAAAGSGKTRAITDRIVALAQHPQAEEWLPRLLVVTYTNRAATEMQQRARQSIIAANLRPEVLVAFNRAFFGTIHSLCSRLLRQHGHHLGLRGQLDHLDEENDAELWREFLQQQSTLDGQLDPDQRRTLLRLVPAQRLMELARRGQAPETAPLPGPFPAFDFGEIHAFAPNKGSLAAATRCREALLRWEEAWAAGGFAGALPDCESKPLRETWEAAVSPVRRWIRLASLHVAAAITHRYQEFRLQRGAMTYGDQVSLAAALLRDPDAAHRIRAKGYRVILDEAQDTDPTQFEVLLQIARPPEAQGDWLVEEILPPRPGHFCMVGDFQQSIFGDRADLHHYRRVHELLQQSGAGEALEFSVTFRLDEASLHFVNAALPAVLHGSGQQVSYVRLNPRPAILGGQVARFDLGPAPDEAVDWKEGRKARWEADQLARWLRDQGLEKLRARSWSEVALLCPRNRWLPALSAALRSVGLEAQVQSERAIKGDNPAYAWFTALVVVLAQPRNGFEIVGVLREVFGLSDQALADFGQGKGRRFQIALPNVRGGIVGETLNTLAKLRADVVAQPLFTALQTMVAVTKLRERLLALPSDIYEGLDKDLANLLTRAATAEADGATLDAFATDLTLDFSSTRDVRTTIPHAVQIISGYKAKGSEWDAVIVPYFARGVTVKAAPYPRMLRHPHTREYMAALDGGDVNEDLKSALETKARQELERLLYVALTRARHTMVLVDDRALFCGKSGLPKNAQARLLNCAAADTQAALFDALPQTVSACPSTGDMQAARLTGRRDLIHVAHLAPCTPAAVETGRARASFFIKRNPSALAEAAASEADSASPPPFSAPAPATTGPNPGQIYGTWWHEFIERLDWRTGATAWDVVFQECVGLSPDPDRSRREWQLLRANLTPTSALGKLLTPKTVIAHAELPFLWAMNERECLDGIIDLAVHDPTTGSWLILDWKTNSKTEKELGELHEHYRPQLSAYWQAVGQMLNAPVSAGIYSTTTGRWLPYSSEELATSWENLRTSPDALEHVLDDLEGRQRN
jgi:ATP-dependent helicase/nuclease subunit A